jgi:hypothetical protein
MNIHNHNSMERTSIIKKIVENDSCNRIFMESKMIINSNQNIGSNITNSDQNLISNIDKRKKRMFWSFKPNEILKNLISEYTIYNEIISRFLLQKIKLNLTFNQVICHLRELKLGQIKNKSNTIQENERATINP